MTCPNLVFCRCGEGHEHSDFTPYPCADCSCEGYRAPVGDVRHAVDGADSPPEPSHGRAPLTLPAELGFARQRVTQAQEWLDQILAGIHETGPRDPDDPLAVCGLADILEQANTQGIDPYDALALAIRRLQDACRPGPRRARDVLRRIRPR